MRRQAALVVALQQEAYVGMLRFGQEHLVLVHA